MQVKFFQVKDIHPWPVNHRVQKDEREKRKFHYQVQTRPLCNHFYRGANTSFRDRITLGFQIIIAAILHSILSLVMDVVGALLGLFGGVAADVYQGFNHPLESIHFIIPYNKVAGRFQFCKHICFFMMKWFTVSYRSHTLNYVTKLEKIAVYANVYKVK